NTPTTAPTTAAVDPPRASRPQSPIDCLITCPGTTRRRIAGPAGRHTRPRRADHAATLMRSYSFTTALSSRRLPNTAEAARLESTSELGYHPQSLAVGCGFAWVGVGKNVYFGTCS